MSESSSEAAGADLPIGKEEPTENVLKALAVTMATEDQGHTLEPATTQSSPAKVPKEEAVPIPENGTETTEEESKTEGASGTGGEQGKSSGQGQRSQFVYEGWRQKTAGAKQLFLRWREEWKDDRGYRSPGRTLKNLSAVNLV